MAVTFRIPYTTHPGQSLLVTGNVPELGNWEVESAVYLDWNDHIWSKSIEISSKTFEYKYIVKYNEEFLWESGVNRRADSEALPRGLLEDYWEANKFVFYIYAPVDPALKRIHVTGSPNQLGAWHDSVPLELDSEEKQLRTGEMKRCWKTTVVISKFEFTSGFEYRFIEIDTLTGSAVWEREPNRWAVYSARIGLLNSQLELFNEIFVAAFNYKQIGRLPLYLGPYPQSRSDIEALGREGITAVFNVQTQQDIDQRRVNVAETSEAYSDLGILHERCPIEDFDAEALKGALKLANDKLAKLHSEGHTIYIHCTAGIGRAPAVIIAFLKLTLHMTYDEARTVVFESRPFVAPNERVLKEVLGDQLISTGAG